MADIEWVKVSPLVSYRFHDEKLTVCAKVESKPLEQIVGSGGKIYQTFSTTFLAYLRELWEQYGEDADNYRDEMINALGHTLISQAGLNMYALHMSVAGGKTTLLPLGIACTGCRSVTEIIKTTCTIITNGEMTRAEEEAEASHFRKLMGE